MPTRRPPYRRLPRSFYARGTLSVARDLLGKVLVRHHRGRRLAGTIVEVEAYLGRRDPASHAYRGPTPRNEAMFSGGGHLYVYFTYGMHFCANVVTGRRGSGHAVLLRALAPVEGISLMIRHRGSKQERTLCSGPGRLCQAMAIGRKDNGTDLCGGNIWIGEPRGGRPGPKAARSTRVGIRVGREHRWRFFVPGDPHVSPGKPVVP